MGKWKRKERPVETGRFSKIGAPILTDGSLDYSYNEKIRLNRSRHLPYASTYSEAKEISTKLEIKWNYWTQIF